MASSGNVTDEVIIEYIKNQDMEGHARMDNFTLDKLQEASSLSSLV